MALSRPRPQFAHRRTVRLMVDDEMDIDAMEIARSLPDFAANLRGIVPQFGGRCFDITLDSAEAAARLAQAGFDHGDVRKPLRLLGVKAIHVSIFVSVEFPDEDLLAVLEQYGELKTRTLRRLHFPEEGFKHIENGVRVAEFNKIHRDIPKRVVLAGVEIGFKYSGQPATCYRCQSTDHVVKNCPKRRRQPDRRGEDNIPPPPANNVEPHADPANGRGEVPEDSMEVNNTAPELFTPPTPSPTYAEAANGTTSDEIPAETITPATATTQSKSWDFLADSRATKGGRKRDPPPPTSSDEEPSAPKKHINAEPADCPAISAEQSPDQQPTPGESSTPSPPSPSGLKNFMTALTQGGPLRQKLMKAVPAPIYYRCRGLYLYYKYGEFSDTKSRKYKPSPAAQEHWESLTGTVTQDAFAQLLVALQDIQRRYKLFTTD